MFLNGVVGHFRVWAAGIDVNLLSGLCRGVSCVVREVDTTGKSKGISAVTKGRIYIFTIRINCNPVLINPFLKVPVNSY
ncbi:MAG: hypothetical protein ACD_39C01706G0001 [uncultured bacterium]|nr:MAG: hypothetical protein ACD_39C01706G0001 [uncultured bacterium]